MGSIMGIFSQQLVEASPYCFFACVGLRLLLVRPSTVMLHSCGFQGENQYSHAAQLRLSSLSLIL